MWLSACTGWFKREIRDGAVGERAWSKKAQCNFKLKPKQKLDEEEEKGSQCIMETSPAVQAYSIITEDGSRRA